MHAILEDNTIEYSAANLMKITYKNKVLMTALLNNHGLQPDGSPDKDTYSKWRVWEDKVKI